MDLTLDVFAATSIHELPRRFIPGKLVFHIFGVLPEFEREIIRERTKAGLRAARARGKQGGRPKALTKSKAEMARQLYQDKTHSIEEICQTFGISRATLWRYVKADQA